MTHPRPWHKQRAKKDHYRAPIYLVAADGRKICSIWGTDQEREDTADMIIRAVNAYDLVMKKRQERSGHERRNGTADDHQPASGTD